MLGRIALLPLVLGACDRVSEFTTAPGEAYCGQVTLASEYRAGFSPRVQMALSLDTAQIDQGGAPGAITTVDAGLPDGEQRLLDQAPLRAIAPLAHDSLSELEFGDGREQNYLFAVSPNDGTAESLLAVVSLRSDDAVEVRLLRPGAGAAEPPAGREPLFGVFVLERREGGCGF